MQTCVILFLNLNGTCCFVVVTLFLASIPMKVTVEIFSNVTVSTTASLEEDYSLTTLLHMKLLGLFHEKVYRNKTFSTLP